MLYNTNIMEQVKKQKRDWVKNPPQTLEECLQRTFDDPVIYREGKDYDLLREALDALDKL